MTNALKPISEIKEIKTNGRLINIEDRDKPCPIKKKQKTNLKLRRKMGGGRGISIDEELAVVGTRIEDDYESEWLESEDDENNGIGEVEHFDGMFNKSGAPIKGQIEEMLNIGAKLGLSLDKDMELIKKVVAGDQGEEVEQ